jgi:cyclopropane-fatty-acyl-phospholipid synthase
MLEALLRKMIKTGDLTAHLPGGRVMKAGDGTGPPVVLRLNGKGLRKLVSNPGLGLGEGYMDGDIVLEQGTMWDLLEIVGKGGSRGLKGRGSWTTRARKAIKRRLQQMNDRVASRRNVAHHYDVSNALYRRFLDADMQYSCAYFERPDMTLEEAQAAKKAHIGKKLLIEPGMKTLDIGSGSIPPSPTWPGCAAGRRPRPSPRPRGRPAAGSGPTSPGSRPAGRWPGR